MRAPDAPAPSPSMSPTASPARGLATIALAAMLWGTWPLYARPGGPSGIALAFLTMAVMALPAPFVLRRRDFADRGAVLALGVVGVADAANAALYFSALQRGPVVVAVLTHYLAPVLVALAAPVVLGEARSRRALLAMPALLLGVALVLGDSGDAAAWGLTALQGGGSALFYAALVLASRRAGRSFSPLAVTSLHAVVSAAVLLGLFRADALPPAWDRGLLLALAGALVNGLFAAVLFNQALRVVGAQVVGVLTYLEPLTASVLAAVVLGAPFGVLPALGVLVVLGAGAWAALETTRPPPG